MRPVVVLLYAFGLLSSTVCERNPAPLRRTREAAANEHGRYVIQLKDGTDTRDVHDTFTQQAEMNGHEYRRAMEFRRPHAMVVEMDDLALDMVLGHNDVKDVVEDIRVEPHANQAPPANPDIVLKPTNLIPWHLDRINQRDLPLDDTFSFGSASCRGPGVNVYVLDSGIRDSHASFDQNGLSRVSHMADIIGGDGFGTDCMGHGTAVASIAAGTEVGIATESSIYDVRIFNCVSGTYLTHLEDAVQYVLDHGSAPGVIVMSVTAWAPYFDPTYTPWISGFRSLFNTANEAGFILVTGAGNDAYDADLYLPAQLENVITVGATNKKDKICGFSNIGYAVDLFAPGYGIQCASNEDDVGIHLYAGTSFAAPIVGGLCASLLGVNSTIHQDEMLSRIVSNASKDKIINVPSWSPDTPNELAYGSPLLHGCT